MRRDLYHYPSEVARVRYNKIRLEHNKMYNHGVRYISATAGYSKSELDDMCSELLMEIANYGKEIKK